jgi:hypothetical protein
MRENPEFRRNLWLEVTPQRLAGMPLVLGAIFFLAFLADGKHLAGGVSASSGALYFLICLVWGTRLASEAVMNEIREHTWDGQRMSVLTPGEMTWGKLFGSTVYPWYGALICLTVHGLAAQGGGVAEKVKSLLVMLLAGVLAHGVSLLASLMAIRKERRFVKSQAALFFVLGIVAAAPFYSLASEGGSVITWFGIRCARLDFMLCSLAIYVAWTICGIYHLMRVEMQMKNRPWAWYGFVVFVMVHLSGLLPPDAGGGGLPGATIPSLSAAFFIAIAIIYFMALAERKDFLALLALESMAVAGNWVRFLEVAPRWLITLPVPFIIGAAAVLFPRSGIPGSRVELALFILSCLCFMLRDLGILLFFNFSAAAKRADMLTLLILGILYGVIPATLAAMKLEAATLVFWPRADFNQPVGCVAVALEMLAVLFLAHRRWLTRLAENGKEPKW